MRSPRRQCALAFLATVFLVSACAGADDTTEVGGVERYFDAQVHPEALIASNDTVDSALAGEAPLPVDAAGTPQAVDPGAADPAGATTGDPTPPAGPTTSGGPAPSTALPSDPADPGDPAPPTPADDPSPTTTARPAPQGCCQEGDLDVYVMAKTPFNEWSSGGHWPWMNANYESMVVWEPYWDNRLASFDDVNVYRNAYGIKVNSSRDTRAADHPDWVLRTSDGSPVYLDFDCAGGCPQYAADIGNPEYRAHWLGEVQRYVDSGYRGLYIDDVNYLWRFAGQFGADIEPINPRTGEPLTLAQWQNDMTEFVEQVRAAFPQIEIWHNSIWYVDSPDFDNPLVDRQIRSADVIQLERGMNDPGLKQGSSKFGMQTFMRFIDRVHANGTAVGLLDEHATNSRGHWFNIAGALLINNGNDLVTTEDWPVIAPTGFFEGFNVDLGNALGPRRVVDDTIQREFTDGLVIMNEPRADRVTVALDETWITPAGERVTSVALDGAEAIVLTRP